MAEDSSSQQSLSSLLAAYSQSQAAVQSMHELEEDELKKYLVSPSTATATSPAGTPHDPSSGAAMAMFPPAASTGGSLESALAALGENGRQQLLAILQLANQGGAAGSADASMPLDRSANPSSFNSTSYGKSPGDSHSSHVGEGEKRAKKVKSDHNHSHGHKPSSSSGSSSMKRKSQVLQQAQDASGMGPVSLTAPGAGMSPNMQATSPAYFANAFSQYSTNGGFSGLPPAASTAPATTSTAGHGRNATGEGSTPSSGSSKPSPALSAVTSYSTSSRAPAAHPHRQGSLGYTGAHAGTMRSTGGSASTRHTPSNSISGGSNGNNAGLEGIAFKLPDANYYRSPAMAPGTSSSAFYTDLGEDSDVRPSLYLCFPQMLMISLRSFCSFSSPLCSRQHLQQLLLNLVPQSVLCPNHSPILERTL